MASAPLPSTPNGARTIRLQIDSAVEMLDVVQLVTDRVGHTAGLADDALHWFGMAVHECVVNAIIHGNRRDSRRVVSIEFTTTPALDSTELAVCVRDQGSGFDPNLVPDPLAQENVLRASGRGIFLIRQIMDDVSIQPHDEGGMEVRMLKRL